MDPIHLLYDTLMRLWVYMQQTFPTSACPKALPVARWLIRMTKLNKNLE